MCLVLLSLAGPAWSLKPDPSVGLEVQKPTGNLSYMPGDHFDVAVQITDPLAIVRRVFVRLIAPNNHILNGDEDASPPEAGRPTPGQPELWTRRLSVPLAAVPGRYLLQVEVLGEGDAVLQWKTLTLSVTKASFSLRLLTPASGAVFSRNDDFDATARTSDPKHQARRVFFVLEEARTKRILNGDREAFRKGSLWSLHLHIPATATPGLYKLGVIAYGEGWQKLGSAVRPITVSLAPVSLTGLELRPPSGIVTGGMFRIGAVLADPNNVVQSVVVSVLGPDGRAVLRNVPATRQGTTYRLDVHLHSDVQTGNYTVEMEARGQGGVVLLTRRLAFPVGQGQP